jgi:hypothetical protein
MNQALWAPDKPELQLELQQQKVEKEKQKTLKINIAAISRVAF